MDEKEHDYKDFSIFNPELNNFTFNYDTIFDAQDEKENYKNMSIFSSKSEKVTNKKENNYDSIELDDDAFNQEIKNKEFDDNTNNNEKEVINHLNMAKLNKNEKTNIKRGRIKTSESSNEHTKEALDNKIRKIRIHAITFGIDLINDCIKKELKKIYRKEKIILRGICREITGDITIYFNIHFFDATLDFIYSNPLNEKYSKFPKDSNIKAIKKLKEINNPIINKLLNMQFKDLFSLFVKSDKEYLSQEFGLKKAETFEDFIASLKGEKDYISDLRSMVKTGQFLNFFKHENARSSLKNDKKFAGTNFRSLFEK